MNNLLEIKDLHASVIEDSLENNQKEILKGINLNIPKGEIHVIMGPNGSGKSTLSYVLSGHPNYCVTQGSAIFKGKDLLSMTPDQRAAAGLFLAFQTPVELPGVNNVNFLRTSLNSIRVARGESELNAVDFLKLVREKAKTLSFSMDMLKRNVNVGFSGGEKKRNEVLQMSLLQPSFAILDETDSGLDIDALRIVAEGVNSLRSPDFSALIITHHQRLLDYIKPNYIHVLAKGRIIYTGGAELSNQLESEGYGRLLEEAL
ncbi:MAG: Fe-S cluster assembly ATPase SufC [Commensalibacter sp.]|nr:Fe-S cluster assembly ATPase SufC [Commensalibacter sp.]